MKMSASTMVVDYFSIKNVREYRNGRPVGRVEMVEKHKCVDEMGRESTVSADNSPNRSVMALRSFWLSRFIPYGRPGPKTSQKAGPENRIYKNCSFPL